MSENHEDTQKQIKKKSSPSQGYGFGTFKGVFTPNILTILGVIMYLRFGWVLGSVGLGKTLLIVSLATLITLLTSLSLSELATNMRVAGGGAYYMISRSLGVESGAAIGLPLYLAQTLSVSFYIAGFAESIVDVYPSLPYPVIAVVILVLLTLITFLSANLAMRIQFFVLALIICSLISFFLGKAPETAMSADSFIPAAREPFWKVFAVFFPAVTGILSGLSMSGDLKKPERSIPRGTLAAVLASFLIYLLIPIFLSQLAISDTLLLSRPLIMRDVAKWGNLILYGLWGATLSSALGTLLGAPRTLQALARDGIVPRRLGQGYGEKNNPRIAVAFSFFIALAGVLLGGLNIIATILSMFFLTTYGLLNLSAALEGILENPSWRPKFRVHWIFPLLGALGCLGVMFLISAPATIVATIICGGIYYLMQRRHLNAYWGDMRSGILNWVIRGALYQVARSKPHEKTWRPNLLVFSGAPAARWHLIAIADAIAHGKGFLTVAAIVGVETDAERINNLQASIRNYLNERFVPAIVKVVTAEGMFEGARSLVNAYGFGPLIPNTILLGATEQQDKFIDYVGLVRLIFRKRRNLVIFRESASDASQPLRKDLQIDIWWRRAGRNAGLMLALGYLLKTSPELLNSRLVIKDIVEDESEKIGQTERLKKFIKQENVNAEVEVYVEKPEGVFGRMKATSGQTSLVVLGMREPGEDESDEAYSQYYRELLTMTSDLPPTVLVLSSEEIKFDRIFKLRETL